jgi:hypothetical protein
MPRRHFPSTLLVLALGACGGPARPAPITNTAPATRYTLQPLRSHGGEGRHSPWQSWSTLAGTLELAGGRAKLELQRTTESSPIMCSGKDGFVGVQQCAPPDSQPSTSTQVVTLTGDVRSEAGALVIDLRDASKRLALSCTEAFLGYRCAVTAHDGVFSPIGHTPSQLVLSVPAPRTYALQPTRSAAGKTLTGSLTIEPAATATIVLSIDSGAVTLRASVQRSPAGLVVQAGEPASALQLVCDDQDTQLTCDLTADRHVLGEADHLYGNVVFVARR